MTLVIGDTVKFGDTGRTEFKILAIDENIAWVKRVDCKPVRGRYLATDDYDTFRMDELRRVVTMTPAKRAHAARMIAHLERPSTAYEQLERVRNVLSNADAMPLANDDDQAAVRYHLEQVRAIYRAAWDREQSK